MFILYRVAQKVSLIIVAGLLFGPACTWRRFGAVTVFV